MHESGENYLETILILQKRNGEVRSIDIAEELGYTKASISRAVSILRDDDYIVMNRRGAIEFTEKGRRTAEAIYERHLLISRFLECSLGLDHETAEKDACRIEHIISPETFRRIKTYVADAETQDRDGKGAGNECTESS